MKKRIIALLCLMAMAIAMVATGCQGKTVAYEKGTPKQVNRVSWRGIDDDEFFISGFIGPQDFYAAVGYTLPSLITDESYAKLAEAGINNIVDQRIKYTSPEADKALTLAAKYGITYLLPDPVINFEIADSNTNIDQVVIPTQEELVARIQELMAYESFAGFHLRDEPTSNCFPKLTEAVAAIETARETVGDNSIHGYINAFPGTSAAQLSNGTDSTMDWYKYLRGVCETGIDFLSFDAYPFTNVPGEIQATWLNALGIMNAISDEYEIPFYVWVQCGGGPAMFSTSHRVVNEAEMYYNVGSIVAFGAKGIGYYTLVTPPEAALMGEEHVNTDSILNKYGSRTPFFYYAKKINAQLQAMAPVINNAAHEGVILDNENSPNVYTGDDLLESYRCLKGYSGDSALIGCFDYEGTVALVVMNNSIDNHHAVITLEFDNNYEYEVIQRAEGAILSGKEISLHLEAGEFALVVVQ